MKVWGIIVAAFLPILGIRAETAGVSLVSLSVQIQTGTAREPLTGLDWMLSVTSTGEVNNPNGELRVADDKIPYSHQSFFVLIDPTTTEAFQPFPFAVDVPDQGDSNTNGVRDFFDRSIETGGLQTTGHYQAPDGSGADMTAKWTRAAGQTTGTVQFTLASFPGLVFNHDYSILQYEGALTYSPSNQIRSGSVLLTNVLANDDIIAGPLSLTVTNNSQLGYDSGAWTNNTAFSYTFHSVDSLDQFGTNYVAGLDFDDGYPSSSAQDFQFWYLVIQSSDANTNGVLDLVESTSGSTQPRLEIAPVANGFQLTVHGSSGAKYVLESSSNLLPGSWTTAQLITLNADTQTVPLTFTDPAKFYRLRQN